MNGTNGNPNRIDLADYSGDEIQELIEDAITSLMQKSFQDVITMAGLAIFLTAYGIDHPELRSQAIETAKTLGAKIGQ